MIFWVPIELPSWGHGDDKQHVSIPSRSGQASTTRSLSIGDNVSPHIQSRIKASTKELILTTTSRKAPGLELGFWFMPLCEPLFEWNPPPTTTTTHGFSQTPMHYLWERETSVGVNESCFTPIIAASLKVKPKRVYGVRLWGKSYCLMSEVVTCII